VVQRLHLIPRVVLALREHLLSDQQVPQLKIDFTAHEKQARLFQFKFFDGVLNQVLSTLNIAIFQKSLCLMLHFMHRLELVGANLMPTFCFQYLLFGWLFAR
jgi:hypothetical protein